MVAGTKDSASRVFDATADGFRATMDAGRKAQQAWFKVVGDHECGEFAQPFTAGTELLTRDFTTLMANNMRTMAECFGAVAQVSVESIKTACDEVAKSPSDPCMASSTVIESAVNAGRTGLEAFDKAAKTSLDNWVTFCQGFMVQNVAPKQASKSGK